jgi:hypothetical protein
LGGDHRDHDAGGIQGILPVITPVNDFINADLTFYAPSWILGSHGELAWKEERASIRSAYVVKGK